MVLETGTGWSNSCLDRPPSTPMGPPSGQMPPSFPSPSLLPSLLPFPSSDQPEDILTEKKEAEETREKANTPGEKLLLTSREAGGEK